MRFDLASSLVGAAKPKEDFGERGVVRLLSERNKRVLWLSQHRPDKGRKQELERVLEAGVDLTVENPRFDHSSADVIVRRMKAERFDELVLVAPLGLIEKVCQRGISPLWPVMSDDRRDFLGFDRILEVRKSREEVQPLTEPQGRKVLWVGRSVPPTQGRALPELRRIFGADVAVDHRDIGNAEMIGEIFRNGGYDALVAVVPEAVFERLSELRLRVMRSDASVVAPRDGEWQLPDGRWLRFDGYSWYAVERIVQGL